MKVPKQIRELALRIAKTAYKQRQLNQCLTTKLEEMGVDIDERDMVNALGYLEGDCTAQPLLDALKEL